MGGVTVTVLRRPPADRYGARGTPVSAHVIDGCTVAPRTLGPGSSGELTDAGRVGVVVGLTIYAPPGSDLQAHDEVTIPGVDGTWEVDGDPADWCNPLTGDRPGTVADLTRTVG